MQAPLYQVDAFTSRLYTGNPAAVCLLESWPDDATLQAIAAENNLAETAFVDLRSDPHKLRWFTPAIEVALCGHATLASAYVLTREVDRELRLVRFMTRSGLLSVQIQGELLSMDFPAWAPSPADPPKVLIEALGRAPREVLRQRDWFAVYDDEESVRSLTPDFAALRRLEEQGVIVTAPGKSVDFVSRYFAPNAGIDEDPVTGSAHCILIPYWSRRLGKKALHAHQVSRRGGELFCEDRGERVQIAGHAVLYLKGTIEI
jgi:PhzF family phenazine biosynthesis protein